MKYIELSIGLSVNQLTGESWLKISPKASIEDGEDIFVVAERMKKDISAILKDQPIQSVPYQKQEQYERPQGVEGIIHDIQSVTDLKVLDSYKLLAQNRPEINEAYQIKLKKLSK